MGRKTGARRRYVNKRNNPAKGTKRRAVLLMCWRRQGASAREIRIITGFTDANARSEVVRLFEDYGYDIRTFGKSPVRFVLIGKHKDGKYWDFTRFRKLDLDNKQELQ